MLRTFAFHAALLAKLERPLRIAVLSDIQMERFGDHERRALDAALAEHPDLLLLPGDYVQARDRASHEAAVAQLVAFLRQSGFAPPRGVFAVQGNMEAPGWQTMFAGLPIETFPASRTVSGDSVSVTGLTLADSFDRDLIVPEAPGFHIVVGHAPDFSLGHVDADLLVAGHTHGGQVRLPFVGPLITFSAVPREWAAGVTALSAGRTLVVSRGVGLERGYAPQLRFLCPPEVVIIDVTPSR